MDSLPLVPFLCVALLLASFTPGVEPYTEMYIDGTAAVEGPPPQNPYLWFGPRLGRRKRTMDEISLSRGPVLEESLISVLEDTPWALVPLKSVKPHDPDVTVESAKKKQGETEHDLSVYFRPMLGKRATFYTPRLGKRVPEDEDTPYPTWEAVSPDLKDAEPRETDLHKDPAEADHHPIVLRWYTPRLGKRVSYYTPRLGKRMSYYTPHLGKRLSYYTPRLGKRGTEDIDVPFSLWETDGMCSPDPEIERQKALRPLPWFRGHFKALVYLHNKQKCAGIADNTENELVRDSRGERKDDKVWKVVGMFNPRLGRSVSTDNADFKLAREYFKNTGSFSSD